MDLGISYWLVEHPVIVGFRWSGATSWGSSWFFLASSVVLYALLASALRLLLHLAGRRNPVPLGPLPALHSLAMTVASSAIFLGLLLSSRAEIRDTRWSWRRSRVTNPAEWLLCFPLGTRPSGRVFFWSYTFYLTRFLHLLRTFFNILRGRRGALSAVFRHSAVVCMSFLWLEFSQSFQVLAILCATLTQVVVFGHRFWSAIGLPVPTAVAGGGVPIVVLACQVAVVGCNLACHLGVLALHLGKGGGCNGMGAWGFNTMLNAALMVIFLDWYVKDSVRKKGYSFPAETPAPASTTSSSITTALATTKSTVTRSMKSSLSFYQAGIFCSSNW